MALLVLMGSLAEGFALCEGIWELWALNIRLLEGKIENTCRVIVKSQPRKVLDLCPL